MQPWIVWLIVALGLGTAELLTATLDLALLAAAALVTTGAAAVVGREATALTEVTKLSGRIRIGGEEWTARPYDPDLTIAQGVTVDVLAIEGATALVHPREDPWPY
ncbi:MAG: NfeD family protein [Pseudonocardiaceae bacterium]